MCPKTLSPMKNNKILLEETTKFSQQSPGVRSDNSGMCMQEIVSPFRNLKLRKNPEEPKTDSWQINPVQLKIKETEQSSPLNQPFGIVDEEDYEDPSFYESPGGPQSPVESPIKTVGCGQWLAPKESGSPEISPGKVKQVATIVNQEKLRGIDCLF